MKSSQGLPKRYPRLRPKNRPSKIPEKAATSIAPTPQTTTPAATATAAGTPPSAPTPQPHVPNEPSLDPYVGRLERFELFSTNQCYYVVGSNKSSSSYRIIKIDRTLIERPPEQSHGGGGAASNAPNTSAGLHKNSSGEGSGNNTGDGGPGGAMAEIAHTAKPTLRPLSDFVTEDPNTYTQNEIREMLDMIHDGNRMTRKDVAPGEPSTSHDGG